MKIIFCGGHHNSALLVARRLKQKGHRIFWFGHKYTMIGDRNPGAEYLEVSAGKIPFIEIKAGKWQPRFNFLINILRIPSGFLQSLFWLIKIRPNLIVSFGGYLALPVSIAGFFLRVPVITHEQTAVSGVANNLISKIAVKVFVSFPSSVNHFPSKKVVLTGLPIRTEIFDEGKKLFENSKKTIYITGGKQGAHLINEEVFKILPKLLENFNVIHQCGSTSLFTDILTGQRLKEKLDKDFNYLIKEYFFEDEIGSVFKSADFVVSRAGAHTVYELMYLNKPAILIPIPWSNKDEQMHNAQTLKEMGLAEILEQRGLEKGLLLPTVEKFSVNLKNYQKSISFKIIKNATQNMVDEIEKILNIRYNGINDEN